MGEMDDHVIADYDDLDISVLTKHGLLVDRLAITYRIIDVRVCEGGFHYELYYTMDTDLVGGYAIEVCATMLNYYVAHCTITPMVKSFKIAGSAEDVLELYIQRISSGILQKLVGDANLCHEHSCM